MKFNQKAYLKPCVDINTELKMQNVKTNFRKDFIKLMNHEVLGKTMENVRKRKDIKPVSTEARRNYLVLESNYHAKFFFQILRFIFKSINVRNQ